MLPEHVETSLIDQIAEEFLTRLRCGERPAVEQYARQHPGLAGELRSILPAMALLEHLGPENDSAESQAALAEATGDTQLSVESLGDYRVLRQVGHGGMGVVYEAVQESLGRHVALKVLPAELSKKAKTKQRFQREARAAAKLHHTSIVPVFSVGRQGEVCYYAMQFIRGLSLAEVIDALKRLRHRAPTQEGLAGRSFVADRLAQSLVDGDSFRWADAAESAEVNLAGCWAGERTPHKIASKEQTLVTTIGQQTVDTESVSAGNRLLGSSDTHAAGRDVYSRSVARLGVQVADALAHAHAHGVLHRDIKPANLMLDLMGHAWVTDFGLAKVNDDEGLTKTGDILGTLRYMAPEVFRGEADERSDVCSLGLTLYELLALRPAFDDGDRATLIRRMMSDRPPGLRELDAAIPRDLEMIVHKAIQREPLDRYASAADLAGDLQRFLNDEPIRARPLTPVARLGRWCRRNPALSSLTALLLLMLATVTVGSGIAATYFRDLVGQREDALALAVDAGNRETDLRITAERRLDDARYNLYISHVQLAREDWQVGQLNGMIEMLESHIPAAGEGDLRGWEWFYLMSLTQRDLATLRPDIGPIVNVKWSADRRYLAAAGDIIAVCDAVTHEPRFQILEARHFAWSPAGNELAVTSRAGEVSVWDADLAQPTRRLGDAPEVLKPFDYASAWSPDGRHIAVGAGLRLLVWSVEGSGRLVTLQIDNRLGAALCIDWSPAARFVCVGGNFPGWAEVWDIEKGQSVIVKLLHGHAITDVAWSRDGTLLASSGWCREVFLWNTERWALVRRLEGVESNPHDLCWSPDGKHLAAAGHDGRVAWWDVESGAPQGFARGHRGPIQALDWPADGQQIATGSRDEAIKLWAPFASQEYDDVDAHGSGTWSPNGTQLAVIQFLPQRHVSIMAAQSKETISSFMVKEHVYGLDFSPDGSKIAAAFKGGAVGVWKTGAPERLWHAPAAHHPTSGFEIEARCVDWSPDGRVLASCGTDKTVKLWDGTSGRLLRTLTGHEAPLGAVTWRPDGRRLASTDWQCHVKIWNTNTWAVQHELMRNPRPDHAPDGQRPLAYSADGRYLAGGGAAGIVYIWDAATGHELLQLHGHTANIRTVAWTPDGRRLASGSEDGQIKIWDPASGREMLTLHRSEWVDTVDWNPDGRRLLTSSKDVKLWDATSAYERFGQ